VLKGYSKRFASTREELLSCASALHLVVNEVVLNWTAQVDQRMNELLRLTIAPDPDIDDADALELIETSLQQHLNQATTFEEHGDHEAAINEYNQVLQIAIRLKNPVLSRAAQIPTFVSLGLTVARVGHVQTGIEFLQKALALSAENNSLE